MSPQDTTTPPSVAAAANRQGKRRRRPATGRAEIYRKTWGRQWGDYSHQDSETLKAGGTIYP